MANADRAAIDGLMLLSPADQQEEAAAIAMVLREALETPGATAALVTPDRDLAGRVATDLLRYGVVADDSAGEALAESPPAVFLRLLARAVAEELAPVALLALLKHPLAAAGLSPAACRAAARALELACLRGPRPRHGVTGLRRGLDRARADTALLERLEACLEPALRIDTAVEVAPALALAALIEAAERLAATDELPGPSRLWAGEEGEALATRLAEVQAALPLLPDQRRDVLPGLLDAVLEGEVVRSRRALRGRDGTEHPRVFIWGLLEARLQTADVMVLGGLAEGVWPPASDPGAWLSRPMRATVGLPSPEEIVGQSAHDFVSCASAAPTVVLSCPRRRDGAPVVPARWLTRLETLLAGQGKALPRHPAAAWVRALDQPADGPRPVRPPRPCPPVVLRPRRLSVTEIETWLRDPYAIHARHVLRLNSLRPLDEATDAADYGSLVHAGLHHFLAEHGTRWPADAAEGLRRAMARALAEADLREALAAWWAPRLERIADWVAEVEAERRSVRPPVALVTEASGTLELDAAGRAVPAGRPGRPDRAAARGRLAILDYKTGTPPSQKEVDAGLAPQLLLEAAMAAAGAFGEGIAGAAEELTYWHLTGGFHAGELRTLFKADAGAIAAAVADGARGAVRADRCVRRAGPLLSVAAAARVRAAVLRLCPARAGGGVGGGGGRGMSSGWPGPLPPTPSRKGRGSSLDYSPSPCGRGLGGGGVSARPRQRRTAPGLRPVGLRLRRRLGRIGQDQAADRPAAAPDAGRRGARAHPVPHLHQGRRRRDGGAAAEDPRQVGHAGRRRAGARTARAAASNHPNAMLTTARALFARVLDLPGGMRIGTIHAFCQSLLRRFPLEASLSPHFRLVDDRDAEDALTEARETMLAHASAPKHACRAGNAGRARIGGPVRHARRDAAARSAAAARRTRAWRRARGRAAPRSRRHRRDGSGHHRRSR